MWNCLGTCGCGAGTEFKYAVAGEPWRWSVPVGAKAAVVGGCGKVRKAQAQGGNAGGGGGKKKGNSINGLQNKVYSAAAADRECECEWSWRRQQRWVSLGIDWFVWNCGFLVTL